MKRLVPLLLVVLALAAVPAALADDGTTPAAPTAASATAQHRDGHARLQLLRLELRVARLRYGIACRDTSSDRCAQVTQKLVTRLTKLEGAVQSKLGELQCAAGSTERKCTALTKLDTKLQDLLAKLQA